MWGMGGGAWGETFAHSVMALRCICMRWPRGRKRQTGKTDARARPAKGSYVPLGHALGPAGYERGTQKRTICCKANRLLESL